MPKKPTYYRFFYVSIIPINMLESGFLTYREGKNVKQNETLGKN